MTTQGEAHNCGGIFELAIVTVRRQVDSLLFIFQVEGLRCSECDEGIITRDTAVSLEQAERSALMREHVGVHGEHIWTYGVPNIILMPSPRSLENQEISALEQTGRTVVTLAT